MADLEELTGVYLGEKYRFPNADGDVVIGEMQVTANAKGYGRLTIKGTEERQGDIYDPAPHMSYRFYGRFADYRPKNGGGIQKQFHYKKFVRVAPHTRAGVVKYLQRAPNIGQQIAIQLWDKFTSDAVRVLRETPDVAVAAVPSLRFPAAREASEFLERESSLEGCMIDLADLLDGRGFSRLAAKEALKQWGNKAAEVIKQNPFRMMGTIPGAGFKRCDAMYLELGGDPKALRRQSLCAWNALGNQTAQTGDTWSYFMVAEKALKSSIGGASVKFEKALKLAKRGRLISAKWTDGQTGPLSIDGNTMWLSTERRANNEQRLAGYIREALAEPAVIKFSESAFDGTKITQHQADAVGRAFSRSNIGILGGTPGCGKTFTIAHYLKWLAGQVGGWEHIAVCAPFGKAAVRMTEAMSDAGVPLRATTAHSMLGVLKGDGGDSGWQFEYGPGNPLPFRVLVIDEMSTIDVDLFCSVMAARARNTMVILVGDVNQLQPVGHGAPLRDMIAAGVSYGELTELHRNSGAIERVCKAIKDEQPWEVANRPDLKEKVNLVSVHAPTPGSQLSQILATVNSAPSLGCHPIYDVQVICPVKKNSELETKSVNKMLQKALNVNPEVHGTPFRLDDKVINTKNRYYPAIEFEGEQSAPDAAKDQQGRIYVANGDIGYVIALTANYIDVKLSAPIRFVRVPRGSGEDDAESEDKTGTGCDWDLAYALTCHKLQGSEVRLSIVVIDEAGGARRLCDRSWYYTAISRAKLCCFLVGKVDTVKQAIKKNAIATRKTFLKELITG